MTKRSPIYEIILAQYAESNAKDEEIDCVVLGSNVVVKMEAQGGRMDTLREVIRSLGGSVLFPDDCPGDKILLTNREGFLRMGMPYDAAEDEDDGN